MTTAEFRHIDTSKQPAGTKPWSKVDADAASFTQTWVSRPVTDLRSLLTTSTSTTDPAPSSSAAAGFTTDSAGFTLLREPTAATEATFLDDAAVRGAYYAEVEALIRKHLPDGSTAAPTPTTTTTTNGSATVSGSRVSKVVIFDHTIRRRTPDSARQPVQQVHVDQTPGAAAARVRRHVRDAAEAERLLAGRYQIINVWRPIGRPASEFPLAVVDWRSTRPEDFVAVDLLYPARKEKKDDGEDDDDRGREVLPDAETLQSTEGYEVRGETFGVRPGEHHRFYYARDMRPDEVLLLKCYDSFGEGEAPLGRRGVAVRTPHTAFVDPLTPEGALPRQSIEVRCLVFYE